MKEIIRLIAMIPLAAILPKECFEVKLFLLVLQISCFALMFKLGWGL